MSGETTKERVTTTYTRVPSKSKLLANELPKKETTLQIKRHSDNIKPTCSVIAMWEVVTLTQNALWSSRDLAAEEWPSEQVMTKAVCLKMLKVRRCRNPSPFWGAFICEAEVMVAAGISDCSMDFLKCRQSTTTYSIGAAFLVQVHFQTGSLLVRLWSLESLFLVLVILPSFIFCHRLFSHVAAWPKVWQTARRALGLTKTEIRK